MLSWKLFGKKIFSKLLKSNLLYYLGLDVLQDYRYSDVLTEREINILDTDINTDFDKLNGLVQKLENRRDYLAQKIKS